MEPSPERSLTSLAAELADWRAQAPVVTLEDLDSPLFAALLGDVLGRLWEARVGVRPGLPAVPRPRGAASADVDLERAEVLVRHVVVSSAPEQLAARADLVRRLVEALRPAARQVLLDQLGDAGGLRRRYVETLLVPTAPHARAYAAFA